MSTHDTAARAGLWHRLYHGETTFDFVGKRRIGFLISGILLAVSAVSLLTRDLNLGIDFEGGVAWEFPVQGDFDTDAAGDILSANGLNPDDAKIQTLGSGGDERIRVQVAPQPQEVQQQVRQAFAEGAGLADVEQVGVTSVGPTWGDEITRKALRALVFFFIAIALYITLRFEWRMALGALAAVVHDVGITVGIYSIFGFEVSPATVVAFLTILGYSLYDTIVVFDKVHENARRYVPSGRVTYSDVVNLSMNQVLMRSLNTTIAALLPVLSLLIVGSMILGAVAIQDFALALFVGLLTGAYSSIYIATPILAALKEREPRHRKLREKLGRLVGNPAEVRAALAVAGATSPVRPKRSAARPAREPVDDSRPGDEGVATDEELTPATASVSGARPTVSAGLSHPPRPRKKKRR
jgi:preprotein translocase subunit SecF